MKHELDVSDIYMSLEEGLTLKEVSEKHKVSITKVVNVRDNFRGYKDLDTGEFIMTVKNISWQQQYFYMIYDKVLKNEEYTKNNNTLTEKEKVMFSKSLSVRLATYLGVNRSTVTRWIKSKYRLVTIMNYNMRHAILGKYIVEQEGIMRGMYSGYFLKGHKLYYANYTSNGKFAYYINKKCKSFYESDVSEYEFINSTMKNNEETEPYIAGLSAKLGIELCKWVRRQESNGYSYEECLKCLASQEEYSKIEYIGNLIPPSVIYYETKGFVFLSEQQKAKILIQLERGNIAGTFNVNPMEEMVLKLQRIA